jgi:hypothetical protein
MFGILSILSFSAKAEFSDSCGLYAQMLWTSASSFSSEKSTYEMAKSTYEMEESSYESACNSSYGYSKNDSSACGTYGYVRTAYVDAFERVKSARNDYDMAKANLIQH